PDTSNTYTVAFVHALGGVIQPLMAVPSNTTPATLSVSNSRGTNLLSATLGDAFGRNIPLNHLGDYGAANGYDGFDRLLATTDALGNVSANLFDPSSRVI